MSKKDSMKFSSSVLAGGSYDYEEECLYLDFNSGATYKYAGVPADVWENLKSAKSHGSYFCSDIKGVYDGSKY